MDMPQCLDADSPAFSNRDRPTNDTVGTMVSGVTYFKIFPISPENNLYLNKINCALVYGYIFSSLKL